jgi:hypothetical protein
MKEETLYHFQNNEIAHYSDYPEDRFVWATGLLEAVEKLKQELAEDEIEWDIDDFEGYEVYAEGEKITRKVK